jgi:hypothetical protein
VHTIFVEIFYDNMFNSSSICAKLKCIINTIKFSKKEQKIIKLIKVLSEKNYVALNAVVEPSLSITLKDDDGGSR